MTDEIGRMFGHLKPRFFNQPDATFVLPDTDIGMEFEFEKVKKNHRDKLDDALSPYWSFKKDDSLHDEGLEFVFLEPIHGKDVVEAVKKLLVLARDCKWACSLRCGIHVHMDVRDMKHSQLLGLLVYYAMFEPLLYAWIGDDRDANNFCAPWYKCETSVYDAARILTMMDGHKGKYSEQMIQRLRAEGDSFHKYAGCNLKPLAQFGSVEFRHLRTTTDYDRIVNRINLIFSLKKAALSAPESSMSIITTALHQGLSETVFEIFPKNILAELNLVPVLNDVMTLGVPNAVELLTSINDAQEWVDTICNDKPDVLHPGYVKWRNRSAPKEKPVKPAIRKLKLGGLDPSFYEGSLADHAASLGLSSSTTPHQSSMTSGDIDNTPQPENFTWYSYMPEIPTDEELE